jgi:hypothetical protein
MKIYLASYLEPESHGPGKKYGIHHEKTDKYEVDGKVSYLTPAEELFENYDKKRAVDAKEAADYFNKAFYEQLKSVYIKLKTQAKAENKSEMELLPFKDGDTLLSWEREGNSNYRGTVAGLLKKIGYEIILK